ncbi:hypothetical protein L1887_62527 [Cichorium endivia]|nr:hypothetical protein L1887_62527 [Cichorium endivia]
MSNETSGSMREATTLWNEARALLVPEARAFDMKGEASVCLDIAAELVRAGVDRDESIRRMATISEAFAVIRSVADPRAPESGWAGLLEHGTGCDTRALAYASGHPSTPAAAPAVTRYVALVPTTASSRSTVAVREDSMTASTMPAHDPGSHLDVNRITSDFIATSGTCTRQHTRPSNEHSRRLSSPNHTSLCSDNVEKGPIKCAQLQQCKSCTTSARMQAMRVCGSELLRSTEGCLGLQLAGAADAKYHVLPSSDSGVALARAAAQSVTKYEQELSTAADFKHDV